MVPLSLIFSGKPFHSFTPQTDTPKLLLYFYFHFNIEVIPQTVITFSFF